MNPAATLTLHKYHGLGNDFLVALEPETEMPFDPATARRLCDRRRGVGADGLIRCGAAGGGFSFRLWNADGSEAEMSGNGIRCAAHAIADAGLAPGWSNGEPVQIDFATPAGPRQVTLRPHGRSGGAWGSVSMGAVSVRGDTRRCNVGHGQMSVDVGNPHLVVLGPDPASVDVAALGAALETAVPGGRNVEFVALGPGPDEITMRVWERGVGETLACGTGSCAAAAALHHWGRVGSTVTVRQPGGSVEVVLAPDGTATLSGPSERVADCVVFAEETTAVA